jgi:pimeloyl-ACP methyl ester carboxylesterase
MSRFETLYADLPDLRMAYREQGEGAPLLFLHGNSESKKIFAAYQTIHFADFRTLAPDSRGHGQSRTRNDSYTISLFSDDVIAFCAAKEIREAGVVGYSDGGNIALFLGLKAPHLFTKIVAVSPNYLAEGISAKWLKLFRAAVKLLTFLGRLGINTRRAVMRFELMLNDIGLSDDDLRAIRGDIKILYAEKDLIREDHLLKIAALIPGASVVKIGSCNHFSILKKTETIAAIKEFLHG